MSVVQQFSPSASLIDQKKKLREGFLKKKSPRKVLLRSVWQERWFVLYDDVLQYFKKKSDVNPAGMIPIQAVSNVILPDDKKDGRFDIVVGETGAKGGETRIFALEAASRTDAEAWARDINELFKVTPDLNIAMTGKFWKNTGEIREARAKSEHQWGAARYLLQEDVGEEVVMNAPSDTKTPSLSSQGEEETSLTDEANGGGSPEKTDSIEHKTQEAVPFELIKKLFDGPFGKVYSVKDRKNGALYLMHVLRKTNETGDTQGRKLFKDMATLDHPYIFSQVHSGETSDSLYGVYTYAIDQSLFVHLRTLRRFPEHVAKLFVAEVVLALGYLHKRNVTFWTMGPERIFLDEDGHAVISDFLLCLPRDQIPAECHTAEYDTPEWLVSEQESVISDWWRLGVFLYELVVGFPPFRSKDLTELAQKIKSHSAETLRFPPFVSKECKDVINMLLDVDPKTRLGALQDADEVKSHAFFSGIDFSKLQSRFIESPDWVDEMLQSERRQAAQHEQKSQREFQLVVGVKSARNLYPDGRAASVCCDVSFGHNTKRTAVSAPSATPSWEENIPFNAVQSAAGDIVVKVIDVSRGAEETVGTVVVNVNEVKQTKFINAWYSNIAADGHTRGDLHLSVIWAPKVVTRKIEHAAIPKRFSQVFQSGADGR